MSPRHFFPFHFAIGRFPLSFPHELCCFCQDECHITSCLSTIFRQIVEENSAFFIRFAFCIAQFTVHNLNKIKISALSHPLDFFMFHVHAKRKKITAKFVLPGEKLLEDVAIPVPWSAYLAVPGFPLQNDPVLAQRRVTASSTESRPSCASIRWLPQFRLLSQDDSHRHILLWAVGQSYVLWSTSEVHVLDFFSLYLLEVECWGCCAAL